MNKLDNCFHDFVFSFSFTFQNLKKEGFLNKYKMINDNGN